MYKTRRDKSVIYILMLFMLASGYYTFTFGISQWKRKNRLGGFSTIVIALLGTIIPILVLYMKNR
jgi:predicted membrane channel-forming protein YqfA (hemolysin III family)